MKDLQKKNEKELSGILQELRKKLRDLRFGASGSKVRNVKEVGQVRKDIARILTEVSRRNKQV